MKEYSVILSKIAIMEIENAVDYISNNLRRICNIKKIVW